MRAMARVRVRMRAVVKAVAVARVVSSVVAMAVAVMVAYCVITPPKVRLLRSQSHQAQLVCLVLIAFLRWRAF